MLPTELVLDSLFYLLVTATTMALLFQHKIVFWLCLLAATKACTDFLVTPGASVDGSAMIAYNADDVGLKGVLYHYPATKITILMRLSQFTNGTQE